MYKEKLPGEMEFMLNFEEELSCMNRKYLKVPISDNVIAVYRNEDCSYCDLELLLLFSKSKNDVIICFDTHFARVFQLENILFNTLKRKVFELIKNEFLYVSDLVQIDMEKDLTPKIFDIAKLHYLHQTKPEYYINYHRVSYSIEDLIKMGECIEDFAYEEVETLLENNKKELNDLKEYLIITKILNESKDYFDNKTKIEKIFFELSINEKYKSLTFELENTDGELKSIKVSNLFSNYMTYPIYAIQRICHGRSVLYERKVKEVESYKKNKEYNLNFSRNADYLSKEILEDKEFTKELLKNNLYNFRFIAKELKEDKDYIKELTLYLKKENYYNLKYLFKELPEKLKEDKDIILFFMDEPILISEIYEFLKPELQEDEEVLENYFSNNPILSWSINEGINTWKHLLEKEVILKAFQKYVHESDSLTVDNLDESFLSYIEDEDDALRFVGFKQAYNKKSFFNFDLFNVQLKSDMDFVRKYFNIIRLKKNNEGLFVSIYNALTDKQKEDNDFLCDLVFNSRISNNEYNELPEKIKTKKFNLCMISSNKSSLYYLSKDEQLEYLDTNPEDISYSFLATYDGSAKDAMPFLKKYIKTKPELLAKINIIHSDELVELINLNPSCFKYGIKNMYSITSKVFESIKDKLFVLDVLQYKFIHSMFHSVLLDSEKIDFFKSQIKLPNYNFRYIAEIDKKNQYGLVNNRELITESVRVTGWNTLEYLPSNSPLKEDKKFAYDILKYNCSFLMWFKPIIRKDKEFLKELYLNYSTKQKADLLCLLPKGTAKELLSLEE